MAAAAIKKEIIKCLSEIIDPELGINIVDLGLIYDIKVVEGPGLPAKEEAKPKTEGGKPAKGAHVEIRMTLTSIGCPLAGFFAMQVEEKVKSVKGVGDVHVHVVWEPPWTPDMMSKSAKAMLGL